MPPKSKPTKPEPKVPSIQVLPVEIPKEIRTIEITITKYENIIGVYPLSDIRTQYNFDNVVVGETGLHPICSDISFESNFTFTIECDINSKEEINKLLSAPILFTVIQTYGSFNPELYSQHDTFPPQSVLSYESAVSLYEAFTADDSERKTIGDGSKKKKDKKGDKKKKKDKPAKGSKSSKGSKGSKASKGGKKIKQPENPPVTYGVCALDLFPIFHGELSFSESLIIKPLEVYDDDRMVSYKKIPKLIVSVLSTDLLGNLGPDPVIIYITVESIYNLPNVMDDEDMDYEICVPLPVQTGIRPIIFKNSRLTTKVQEDQMKCWPGVPRLGSNANTTKYKLPASAVTIKNRTNIDIEKVMSEEKSRIEFNYLERIIVTREDFEALIDHLARYNKIAVEVYMREKVTETAKAPVKKKSSKSSKGGSSKSSKGSKGSGTATPFDNVDFLHLMTQVNLSYLMRPCCYSARVASPLTTYHFQEANNFAGLRDSYFKPRSVPQIEETVTARSVKSDKKGLKKDKKKKKKGKDADNDLQYLLPKEVQPVEIEPSKKVLSEEGEASFIIIELELSDCIKPKRDLEDINVELDNILKKQDEQLQNKIILPCSDAKNYFKEAINKITKDLNEKYVEFIRKGDEENYLGSDEEFQPYDDDEMKNENSNTAQSVEKKYKEFEEYIKSEGIYEDYLACLTVAASIFVDKNLQNDSNKTEKEYLNCVGQIYSTLVQEMHLTINSVIGSDLQSEESKSSNTLENLLRFAKDATLRKENEYADQYYLERICLEESNGNLWFDYAVFLMELNQRDKAFRCLYEGLLRDTLNWKCLSLFAILLSDENKEDDARICFEALRQNENCPMEIYGIMYIFFEKYYDYTSMDTILEFVNKKASLLVGTPDSFLDTNDWVWCKRPQIKTLFMRTAVYLLKMRVYNWVELAISYELPKFYAEAHYLLAAVCYYKQQLPHALEHMEEATNIIGNDFSTAGLKGLILMELGKLEQAKEEFMTIMQSFEETNDLTLIYTCFSKTLELLGENKEALKYILLMCQKSPTPFSWFQAGKYYFNDEDYTHAEQCFNEANKENCTLSPIWGYLTLTNLKQERYIEAEFCYRQTIKHNLDDPNLFDLIKSEISGINDIIPCDI